ncbi:NAD(P)H-dependent oxidoreductase [Diaphorobacter aerolatus]|uniref:NAD(P)H-dependent oxidoreductase n=1 Tax=Diaphorobacter aerolatus TaxID=1288495 RepID=UPI0021F7D75B|nr:NAD(P)H-dependent oxidoreductase [Diaphorobacter aerolatus]
MAQFAIAALNAKGHEVIVEDLYESRFSPALTTKERQSYYSPEFDATATQGQIDRLLSAEMLVLIFPTWWFGFPAMLKGWFDRVWAPGVAYDHATDLGPIKPRLQNLRHALAITSLGSPWWVDRLLLWQPVRRVLKTALLGTCAPNAVLVCYRSIKLNRSRRAECNHIAIVFSAHFPHGHASSRYANDMRTK